MAFLRKLAGIGVGAGLGAVNPQLGKQMGVRIAKYGGFREPGIEGQMPVSPSPQAIAPVLPRPAPLAPPSPVSVSPRKAPRPGSPFAPYGPPDTENENERRPISPFSPMGPYGSQY